MRVLFLSQRVPHPPDRGDRITTSHVVGHLAARGHKVTAVCFTESREDEAAASVLRGRGITVVTDRLRPAWRRLAVLPHLLGRKPLSLPWFFSRKLAGAVERVLRETPPDLCFAYSSSMAQYILHARGPRRIQQFAELDSDKWRQLAERAPLPRRLVYAREARRLLAFETEVARAFDLSLVVSEVEKGLFQEAIPGVPVEVLPNGVDAAHFTPAPEGPPAAPVAIFTGVMHYPPNVDAVLHFAAEGWGLVRRAHPDARWLVVGAAPAPAVRALHGRDGIHVTGTVADTVPWFHKAAVALAPLRTARGIQNKVLEAMSCALPVVASPKAAEGIEAEPGTHLVLAEGPEATATAVSRLLADPAERAKTGSAARALVLERYRWDAILAHLDTLIERVMAASAPGAATAPA